MCPVFSFKLGKENFGDKKNKSFWTVKFILDRKRPRWKSEYSLRNIPLEHLSLQYQNGLLTESNVFWSSLSYCGKLSTLSLKFCNLNSKSCLLLASNLKLFKCLTELDLEGNPIEPTGALFLLSEPTKFKSWNLRNCSIDRLRLVSK